MSSEVELLPCPFCGGEGVPYKLTVAPKMWRVSCKNCDAGPSAALSQTHAIAAWNRRSASPSIGRVGTLEWVKHPSADLWRADSLLGRHQVYAVISQISWSFDAFDGITQASGDAADIEAAKAAAQADYETRIRSTLVYHEEPAGDTQGAGELPSNNALMPELPRPRVTFADHSYPAFSPTQMLDFASQSLNNLRAALVSPPDNGGWMPIETAPKDGTMVDLWGTRNGTARRFTDAKWVEIHGWGTGDPTGEFRWSFPAHDIYGEFEFTHWQPLPSPPALQSHNEGSK